MIGPADEASPEEVREISFHYIKAPFYRTVHADGVFGGVTPTGLIEAAIYSERFPIPTYVKHELHGIKLGRETQRLSRDGIVRELECGLVLSLESAELLRAWLDEKIALLKKAESEPVGAE